MGQQNLLITGGQIIFPLMAIPTNVTASLRFLPWMILSVRVLVLGAGHQV